MEEVKEEKILSKKEIRRRKKLGELFEKRRRKGHAKWVRKVRREKAKRLAAEAKKKEKEREKRRLQREKEREKKKLKKKVGRPKKSGPKINYYKRKKKLEAKKNRAPKVRDKLPPFNYKIISCCNGLQNKLVGKYRSMEDAYEVFHELQDSDNDVVFPMLIMGLWGQEKSINEYILIQKVEDGEVIETKLRNEYGKLVDQVTNQDGWVVVDKFRYKKEETFWVYGYNNKNDRKTFTWIYNNILLDGLDNPYEFKRVILFKNKIIFKDDNNNLDLIITKHPSDAIRFYNLLEEWVKKDKLKQVLFAGDYTPLSPRRNKLVEELIELTGWPKQKIYMITTSRNNNNNKK